MLSGTKCPAGKQLIPRSQSVIYLFKKLPTLKEHLDGWLYVHRSITLVDFQLDAQNSYLYIYIYIYNTFIKILYMFRALPCSSSGGLRRNYIHAECGIVTL